MDDLISRAVLNNAIEQEYDGVCAYDVSGPQAISDFQDIVDKQPVVDAAPVVHCRDCKYRKLCFDADGHRLIQCTNPYYPASFVETWPFDLDWYCAGGKWRDEDG